VGLTVGQVSTTVPNPAKLSDFPSDEGVGLAGRMLPAAPRRSAPFRCILGPWFKETFHRYLADKLVGKATGVTVWVVKEP